jgi:hypothetical protein
VREATPEQIVAFMMGGKRDMVTVIWVKFTRAGFHRWTDAPEPRAYLRDIHRHQFHVKVTTSVKHENREIEFHDLLDLAQAAFSTGDGTWSCERMATNLSNKLSKELNRSVRVDVSEDGECGAAVWSGEAM